MILATGVVVLGACGGGDRVVQPTPLTADRAAEVGAHVERGYVPGSRLAVTETRDRWFEGPDRVDLVMLAPSGAARVPLVVYLPALGETAAAGALWRRAWAEAGYAVVSLQPERAGESIGRSALARAGDFRRLAQTAFSDPELEYRLRLVRRALAALARRSAAGTPPFVNIETRSMGVVGFHLGAQTAAALDTSADIALRSVVLIGPVIASGGARLPPRLVVTASGDEEPYGYRPRARSQTSVADGARYLLALNGGTHSMLAGSDYFAPGQSREAISVPERRDAGRGGEQDNRRPPGAGTVQVLPLRGVPRLEQVPFDPRQLAAVIGVTTAFLDATLRDRPEAVQWLERDASRWLAGTGLLGPGPRIADAERPGPR